MNPTPGKTERFVCERALQELVAGELGVDAALVATIDGIELASAARSGGLAEAARFAAMSSSLLALSDRLADDARLGRVRSVSIDTENGRVLLMSIPVPQRPRVLLAFSRPTATLGALMVATRQCAEGLAARIAAV